MNLYRLSILAVLLGIASSAWAKGGYIYEYAGDVKVTVAGGSPRAASDSMPLEDNSTITTGNASRAVIKFEDGQVVVLKPNTSFQIKKYHFDTTNAEKSKISFSLLTGGLRAITGLIGARNKQSFQLTTPTATCGIRGTDFMMQAGAPHKEGKDGSDHQDDMVGQVTKGAITLQTDGGTALIPAGKSVEVTSKTSIPAVTSVAPTTFLQLQVIPAPNNTAQPAPTPGTKVAPSNAADLKGIATGIKVTGVKSEDLAKAMVEVGNSPTIVTKGIVSFDPKSAPSIVKTVITLAPDQASKITATAIKTAPGQTSAIITAAVTLLPNQASAITSEAVKTNPSKAVTITTAAVTALPNRAKEITLSAVTANPSKAAAITSSVIAAVPDQAGAIVDAVGTAMPSKAGPAQSAPVPQAPATEIPAIQLPSSTPPSSGGGSAISPA